jgi:uncharacterized membrane protein
MDEIPKGPEEIPPPDSDPNWGAPNPHYPPPAGGYVPPGSVPPGYVPPGYPPPGYPPPGYPPPGYAQPAGLSRNTAAALAYITFIPALIFLLIEPYKRDAYIRFHAWQCIVLTLVDIAGSIVFGFMGTIGWMVRALLGLLLFIFWLIAIIKASKGEAYHIPIVGDLADTLAAKV